MAERICSVEGCDERAWGRKRRCQPHHEAAQQTCFEAGCAAPVAPGKYRCQEHHYAATSFCVGSYSPERGTQPCDRLIEIEYWCKEHYETALLRRKSHTKSQVGRAAALRKNADTGLVDLLTGEIQRVSREYMLRATDEDVMAFAVRNIGEAVSSLGEATIEAVEAAVEPSRYAQFESDQLGYGPVHLQLCGRLLRLFDRAGYLDSWVLLAGVPNSSVHQVPARVIRGLIGDKIVGGWNEFFREDPPCMTARWVTRASGDDPLGITRGRRQPPLIAIGGLPPSPARFHFTNSSIDDQTGRTMSLTALDEVVAYLESNHLARMDPWEAGADPLISAAAQVRARALPS
jgi:hypothetical protein